MHQARRSFVGSLDASFFPILFRGEIARLSIRVTPGRHPSVLTMSGRGAHPTFGKLLFDW